MSRLPKAWPARPGSASVGAGSGTGAGSVMVGSASASAAMQLRMSPTGAMPSSWRSLPDEPPSSATVTTAVMLLRRLLQAAQERGQAGAAADGHDARPARQRALLVDQLDERLARVPGTAPAAPPGDATGRRHDGDADADDHERAQQAGQELQAHEVEDLTGGAVGRHLAEDHAGWPGRRRVASRVMPRNTTRSQRLIAGAGAQPAAQPRESASIRGRSLTGAPAPGARRSPGRGRGARRSSASASAMATERWTPPVQPMAMVRRVLPSRLVGRHGEGEEARRGNSRKRSVTGCASTNSRTGSSRPGQRAQLGPVERVLHEPDVEDEVRLERHAVLEAEADDLEGHLVGPVRRSRARQMRSRSCRKRQLGGVDDDLRHPPHLVEHVALPVDGRGHPVVLGVERVPMAGLRERRMSASSLPRGRRPAARCRARGARPARLRGRAARPRSGRRARGRPVDSARVRWPPARRGRRSSSLGHVVDDGVAEVLEHLAGRRLARRPTAR